MKAEQVNNNELPTLYKFVTAEGLSPIYTHQWDTPLSGQPGAWQEVRRAEPRKRRRAGNLGVATGFRSIAAAGLGWTFADRMYVIEYDPHTPVFYNPGTREYFGNRARLVRQLQWDQTIGLGFTIDCFIHALGHVALLTDRTQDPKTALAMAEADRAYYGNIIPESTAVPLPEAVPSEHLAVAIRCYRNAIKVSVRPDEPALRDAQQWEFWQNIMGAVVNLTAHVTQIAKSVKYLDHRTVYATEEHWRQQRILAYANGVGAPPAVSLEDVRVW